MNKTLAKKLFAMERKDQQMRRRAIGTGKWDKLVDRKNTRDLKEIIKEHGWPTIPLVGKKASRAAWLVAQHADHDLMFQKHCLSLMKEALKDTPTSIPKEQMAYLIDRIRMHEEKKQLFGTQFVFSKENILKPYSIYDRKNLNKRRREYGLDMFRQYEKAAKQVRRVKSS